MEIARGSRVWGCSSESYTLIKSMGWQTTVPACEISHGFTKVGHLFFLAPSSKMSGGQWRSADL